jgi:hypothetical protein
MYLVELRPGKEELYRSTDALALAIRNGDVDERSRIYHRATAKWISITLHPQYRAIVTAAKEEPSTRPARRGWSLLGGSTDGSARHEGDPQASAAQTIYRWRRPLALGLAGFLLLSGLKLASSGPRPPWAGHGRSVAIATMASRPAAVLIPTRVTEGAELVRLASTKQGWQPPVLDDSFAFDHSRIESGSIALPRAPQLAAKLLTEDLTPQKSDAKSLTALFARYDAAHDSAESRLEAGMRVARLSRLFDGSHLTPNGGVTDTRMSLAGAANFIRVFREQQAAIERAYQDSVTQLARQNGWAPNQVRSWYARTPRKESATLQLISGGLLASIDSLLGVLDAQAGAYKIRGSAIAFEDPAAGQAYGALRRKIKDQINAAVAAGGAISSGPTGLLLQAIGTSSLPRET